jgi:hypothetical protein
VETGQNRFVLRRVGLAVVFFAVAWAFAAQATLESSDGIVMAAAQTCAQPEPTSTGDSDGQWRSLRGSVSITESVWKATLVHAELAVVRRPAMTSTNARVTSSDNRAGPAPSSLLRIPLLI